MATNWNLGEVLEAVCDWPGYFSWELPLHKDDKVIFQGSYDDKWAMGEIVSTGKRGYFIKSVVKRPNDVVDVKEVEAGLTEMHHIEYFDGYNTMWIHHLMLSDVPRTSTYKAAVEAAKGFIKGKVVMDVGCGTGILSMFCAKAGAAKVYAVEASNMAYEARRIIKANNLDQIITVVEGKIEDPTLKIPHKSIDVIISEWMGHFLICEAMIGSVLLARDRYLKPGGLLMPSKSTLYLAPISLEKYYHKKVGFLDDIHGIDFSAIKNKALNEAISEILISPIESECPIAEQLEILSMDMHVAKIADFSSFKRDFKFTVTKDATFHGFSAWFDCWFHSDPKSMDDNKDAVLLSTSPFAKKTHWLQANFMFKETYKLKKGDCIVGSIDVKREEVTDRQFKIVTSCKFPGSDKTYECISFM